MTGSKRIQINFQHPLKYDQKGQHICENVRVAIALLLWEVANVDSDMNDKEHEMILYILDRNLSLQSGEATELLEVVIALEAGKEHLEVHIGELNRAFSSQQKEQLFQCLMNLVTCDGDISEEENDLVLMLREKLNLTIQG